MELFLHVCELKLIKINCLSLVRNKKHACYAWKQSIVLFLLLVTLQKKKSLHVQMQLPSGLFLRGFIIQ